MARQDLLARLVPALIVSATLAAAGGAAAQSPAPSDSLLEAYLSRMRDSTDTWFGMTAAPLDTAGLDTALASGLARGRDVRAETRARRARRVALSPAFGFNRVDGGVLGAEASVGSSRLMGRLDGSLERALSAGQWRGGASYTKRWSHPYESGAWTLRAAAARRTDPFDRDYYNKSFTEMSAFLGGGDRHTYLTRTGVSASLERSDAAWSLTAGIRDHAEHARTTSTEWTLFGGAPELIANAPAREGRVREARFSGSLALPRLPWTIEAQHWTSGRALASDFTYRRTRVAVAGDVGLIDRIALVPQFEWARLRGEALPQQALYLGGIHNLRTYERNERVGSGRAVLRTDLMYVGDLLTRLRVPHPAWMPLSLGVFGNMGAVWGMDRSTGLAAPTSLDWPEAGDWKSEAGISVLWRLGVPDPDASLRADYAFPVGPGDERGASLVIAFQKSLGLLRVR